MVSGKPGIGPPHLSLLSAESPLCLIGEICLFTLASSLTRHLALKLPTALQIRSSYAILFHEGGVSEFVHAEIHPG